MRVRISFFDAFHHSKRGGGTEAESDDNAEVACVEDYIDGGRDAVLCLNNTGACEPASL